MTCFSRDTSLGSVLPDMFDEDHWRPGFCSPGPDSTRPQVDHDCEAGMFAAHGKDAEALRRLGGLLQEAHRDPAVHAAHVVAADPDRFD